MHPQTGDKRDNINGSVQEEPEPALHQLILLRDFNSKVGREDVFKSTIGNDSLHETNEDKEIKVTNLPHKNTWL